MGSYARERGYQHQNSHSRRGYEPDDRPRQTRYSHHADRHRRDDRDYGHRERADLAGRRTKERSRQAPQRNREDHSREQDPPQANQQTHHAEKYQFTDQQVQGRQTLSNAALHTVRDQLSHHHERRYRDRSAERDRPHPRADVRQAWNAQREARPYQHNPNERIQAQAGPQHAQSKGFQQQNSQPIYGQSQQAYIAANGQDRAAWPSQRGDAPFRRGPNPFKGRGKWGHDLFEELIKTADDPPQTAVVKTTQNAVGTAAN